MALWAWTLGPLDWLSVRMPALWSTVVAFLAVVLASVLVVELLRCGPLSLMLTGKHRSRAKVTTHSDRSESSIPAEPTRLGAGRT
jgi:hypothetical protein